MKFLLKKIVLLSALTLTGSYSFAGSYEACLNKMDGVLRSFIANRRACLTQDTPDLSDRSRCMIAETYRFGEESCLSTIKASAKVLNFYWQQLYALDRKFMDQKSTTSEEQERWRTLMALIRKEERESDSRGAAELEAMSQSEAEARAENKIINALQLLGATIDSTNRRNNPNIITYTINGKIINCSTMGTVVNCN